MIIRAAYPSTRVLTMPAFVLKRSSRVMPGLRGTPAGITTTLAPVSAASRPELCDGGHLQIGEEVDEYGGRILWPPTATVRLAMGAAGQVCAHAARDEGARTFRPQAGLP